MVRAFLDKAEGWGLNSAIDLAARSTDRQVTDSLLKIANDDRVDDLSQHAQNEAVMALAAFGEWEAVLAFVERVGFETRRSLMEWPFSGIRPEPGALDGVRQRATKQSVGAVLALGFGKGERDSSIVCGVLGEVEPDSQIALACVRSLYLMRDDSPVAVPLLKKQLKVERTASWATDVLLANGSVAALEALLDSPKRDAPEVCKNLIEGLSDGSVIEEIRTSLSERCASEGEWDLMHDIAYLVTKCDAARQALLKDRRVLDFIWAVAYAPPSSRHDKRDRENAIYCLIEANSEEGFRAARAALMITEIPGRHNYPHILMQADSSKAVPMLLDYLADETQSSVKASIGRALSGSDIDSELARRLSADNTGERVAACFAAGWAGRSEGIERRVKGLITDDPEPEVSQSAISALNRMALRRETKLLAQRVLDADNEFDRWLYLDSLLEFADPGDEYSQWPVEGPLVGDVLSPLQFLHLKERGLYTKVPTAQPSRMEP